MQENPTQMHHWLPPLGKILRHREVFTKTFHPRRGSKKTAAFVIFSLSLFMSQAQAENEVILDGNSRLKLEKDLVQKDSALMKKVNEAAESAAEKFLQKQTSAVLVPDTIAVYPQGAGQPAGMTPLMAGVGIGKNAGLYQVPVAPPENPTSQAAFREALLRAEIILLKKSIESLTADNARQKRVMDLQSQLITQLKAELETAKKPTP